MQPLNGQNGTTDGYSNPALSELTHALHAQPFLSGLTEPQIKTLALNAQYVEFPEQELIIAASHPSQYFYLLLSGSVSIELNRAYFIVRIQHVGAGKAFGWSALLDDHDTLFDVRARERCTALRFENKRLMTILRDDPVLAAELLKRTLNLAAERMLATEKR